MTIDHNKGIIFRWSLSEPLSFILSPDFKTFSLALANTCVTVFMLGTETARYNKINNKINNANKMAGKSCQITNTIIVSKPRKTQIISLRQIYYSK